MSGWTAPDGWGAPTPPPPGPAEPSATPAAPAPGSAPAWGSAPGWGASPYAAPRPDVKPGVVPLRPLGLGEVLDGAVAIIRRYPRPSLGLAALVSIVSTLVQILLQVTAFRPFLAVDSTALESGNRQAFEDAIGGAAAGGLLTGALALLSSAILTGAITAVVGKAVLGQPMTFRETVAQVRPVLLKLVLLSLLVGVIVGAVVLVGAGAGVGVIAAFGGLGALVGIPLVLAALAAGAYTYVRLALAPCALVLERTGIRASLRRSGVLVKGDWWRVFGILALTAMIGAFISLVVSAPFSVLGAGSVGGLVDPDTNVLSLRSLIATALGGAIASTIVSPFTTGVGALLYVDRRIRAEGLDVSLAAAAAQPAT